MRFRSESSAELDREMYHYFLNELSKHGYFQYEISNCAKEGFNSRHNLKYWNLESYLGVGTSSHSYIEGKRFYNTSNIKEYIELTNGMRLDSLPMCISDVHLNTKRENITDYVFTSLRKTEGIDYKNFCSLFGVEFWDYYKDQRKEINSYLNLGQIVDDGESLRILDKGLDILNSILLVFM